MADAERARKGTPAPAASLDRSRTPYYSKMVGCQTGGRRVGVAATVAATR